MKIEIYDPAMYCSSDLCGPSIDPLLKRFLTFVSSMESAIQKALRHFLLFSMISLPTLAHASQPLTQESPCSPTVEAESECHEGQLGQAGSAIPFSQEQQDVFGIADQTVKKPVLPNIPKSTSSTPEQSSVDGKSLIVYFFWGLGCPHCVKEKPFLEEMKAKYQGLQVRDYEVWYNKENALFLEKMAKAYGLKAIGLPVTFVDSEAFVGFTDQSRSYLEDAIKSCFSQRCINPLDKMNKKLETEPKVLSDIRPVPGVTVDRGSTTHTVSKRKTKAEDNYKSRKKNSSVEIPFIGKLDASEISLPLMTLVIAGFDSFNPCAFFVLFSLLGLLVYAQSRKKMFLIGGIFVFFSGFVYFLFMSAWLNFFLIMGHVAAITKIAGAVSLVIAGINIKDFFAFKKGVSLTIPDSAKPKLFDRMRRLLKSTSLLSIATGTAVLAIAANSYELLCTAGFPMVFTRILTLNNLSTPLYYLYLILYNVVYVIPLLIIVIVFTVTLGKRKLSEWQGRILKLASGTMMLGLGGVLFLNPALLNDVKMSFFILAGACALCACVVFLTRQIELRRNTRKA